MVISLENPLCIRIPSSCWLLRAATLVRAKIAPMQIRYFVHATTLDNEAGIATGSAEVELSPLGKQQVQDLKKAIEGEQFDAVFSSDLSRAKETAEGALGDRYQVVTDSRLREINVGDETGKKDTDTSPLLYQHIDAPFSNGDSLRQIEQKMRQFLEEMSPKYENKTIAIFAHQAPQLALEVITKGVSWEAALDNDWRKTKSFQYGWDYSYPV